jgi:pSer/pThr/pTyr-binding forkhead associated (FHA) protein
LLYRRQGAYLAVLLEQKLTTIGAGTDMDIQVEGPGISQRHAVIRRSGEEIHLYDFGSATGVRHNGRRVDMARLREGDRVHVGAQEFVYFALTQPIVEKDE